jgi:hypothetical protein
MPIKVKCKCGQRFSANDKLAGKTVKCPKCAQPIAIPIPKPKPQPVAGTVEQLLEEAGLSAFATTGRTCPECGAEMSEDAVVCVQCGYNEKLGRRMKTRIVVGDGLQERESLGHARLDDAVTHMEEEQEQQERLEAGMPWWGYLIILIAIIIGGVMMGNVAEENKVKMIISIVIILPIALGILFALLRLNVLKRVFQR